MANDELTLDPSFLRKLEHLRLLTRRVHTGRFSALQRSKKLGRGIDFADHRPYTPGDDFKDIDWNLYGRMDRFLVRLAEEETELNLHLLVDISGSMRTPLPAVGARAGGDPAPTGPSKLDFAARVATALAYVALAHLDRVHIWPFGAGLSKPLVPPRHKAQAVKIHRFLMAHETDAQTDLEAAAKQFAGVARSKGIALLISDFLAPGGWRSALDTLRHARFEVGLLQVTAPGEEDVAARGPVVLVDGETGRTRRVRVTDAVAKAYRQAFVQHGEALTEYARAHDLFCAHARSDQPFEEVVLRTMRAERLLA